MKLSAITSRATNKDYIDLYYILNLIKLDKLLQKASKKFKDLDQNLILKSLVYFDDIEIEPIKFKNKNKVNKREVEDFLRQAVNQIVF